jgi:hypothetical protein
MATPILPTGCPQGVSDACANLVKQWMNESGSAAGLLSLYDYYTDVCLADVTDAARAAAASSHHANATASSSSSSSSSSSLSSFGGQQRVMVTASAADPSVELDACSDDHTTSFLNLPSVRAALHVSPLAPPKWTVSE